MHYVNSLNEEDFVLIGEDSEHRHLRMSNFLYILIGYSVIEAHILPKYQVLGLMVVSCCCPMFLVQNLDQITCTAFYYVTYTMHLKINCSQFYN